MMRLKFFENTLFVRLVTGLLLSVVTGSVMALGMGDIELKSSLNQPFNAVVKLSSATDAELKELQIKVAPREMFIKAGLGWTRVLSDLKFSVERTSSGKPIIKITSKQLVSEPFLEIMLEVVWSRGRLIRTYTVLVDPPLTMPAQPAITAIPKIVEATPAVEAPVPVASRPRQAQPAAVTQSSAPPSARQADRYGPVKRNETLWAIAKQVRPDSTVDINQTMLAILRANPNAFIGNNVNNLKKGSILRVPDRSEISSLGSAARSEVNRQYAEWKAQREQQSVVDTDLSAAVTEAAAQELTETRLQLVAPEEGEVDAESGVAPGNETGADEAEAASDALRQQLTQANEEVESGETETGESRSRVSELESQLEQMQRLLELKDEQLASMQDRLGIDPTAMQLDETGELLPEDASKDEIADGQDEMEAIEEVADEINAEDDDVMLNEPRGLVAKAIDNPVLSTLIVIVAMVLGGFFFASARQRREENMFSDEMTLTNRLQMENDKTEKDSTLKATVSEKAEQVQQGIGYAGMHDDADADPVTEADVFLAYGRTQQAETVLLAALSANPDDANARMKLLEVYRTSGDAPAFDDHFNQLQHSGAVGADEIQKFIRMGHELSPQNQNYNEVLSSEDGDFDMSSPDVADTGDSNDRENGLDLAEDTTETLPESIEFTLDEEDASEGMLADDDELATKLDLARAYRDMDDTEGACRILKEVLEQGNEEQKEEARSLLSEYS